MVNPSNVINPRQLHAHVRGPRRAERGLRPRRLGFPAYLAANSQYLQMPYVTFASNSGIRSLGLTGANTLPSQSMQLFGNWSAIRGEHSIRSAATSGSTG